MAKRSYIQAISSKQTSAYGKVTRSAPSILAIDGASKREASRRIKGIKALRSWSINNTYRSEAIQDEQAEKAMNPHGYSSRKNPICPDCQVQKSIDGSCYC